MDLHIQTDYAAGEKGGKKDSAMKHFPLRDATFNLKQHQNDVLYLLDPVHHQIK